MLVRIAARTPGDRDEQGSTLVSVLIIMLVLSLGGMTLAAIVTNTTGVLVDTRSTVQSRAAADAGLAAGIVQAQSGASLCSMALNNASPPAYTVTSVCAGGQLTITSTGFGQDGGQTRTQAAYELDVDESTLDGALVSANGGLNVSSIYVTAIDIDGDVVLNHGNLDCNNSTEISGDVIVRNGAISISNYCHIHGDVIASGGIALNSHARVDGDVHAMGNFTMDNSARVGTVAGGGNVYTRGTATINSGTITKSVTALGNVTLGGSTTSVGGTVNSGAEVTMQDATVGGSVIAAGAASIKYKGKVSGAVVAGGAVTVRDEAVVGGAVTSPSTSAATLYGATVGSLWLNGSIHGIQAFTVNGDVISTRAGINQWIAPNVKVFGQMSLAGTYTTDTPGPTVTMGITTEVGGLTLPSAPAVPVIEMPWQLTTDAFVWSDLPFDEAAWGGAGFSVITTPGCDFQNNPHFVTAVNALTSPTIIDARGCTSEVNMYGITFDLRTDITFLVNSVNGQRLTVASADGAPHLFNLITPDDTVNQAATCTNGSWRIKIDDVVMKPLITGVAYSPCTVHLGQSGSSPSGWNGQVYAGTVTWGGNSASRMELAYREVNLPGLVSNPAGGGAGGAGGAVSLGNIISMRDVP